MKKQERLSRLEHAVGTFFFHFFLGFLRILPWCIFRPLAKLAVTVLYLVSPKMGRYALEGLDIAFGDVIPRREKKILARRSFFALAEGLAWFMYTIEHPRIVESYFTMEGREHLDQALAKGKGAVIAVGHVGPFVWMMQHFLQKGYKVNVVMRPPRSAALRAALLKKSLDRGGLITIYSVPIRTCVVECFQALKRGEIVFLPIDQNYGSAGRVFVDFFSRKAATAPGVIGYSLKTGAEVLMAVSVPEKDGRFRTIIEPFAIEPQAEERQTLIHNTARLTARLEYFIRQHPDQWSWMHRRWKAIPKEGEVTGGSHVD
ncbi:MAG: lysophospholipid acyltransferase family protein [Candidatus Omnitrophica bacterium]|nr:lysophospholipid acyltransferase family protein [Candidatus Omnitrophota bacterium]